MHAGLLSPDTYRNTFHPVIGAATGVLLADHQKGDLCERPPHVAVLERPPGQPWLPVAPCSVPRTGRYSRALVPTSRVKPHPTFVPAYGSPATIDHCSIP